MPLTEPTSNHPGRSDASRYLDELARRLDGVLGDRVAGLYAGGSWALGDWTPAQSDLDVAAVVVDPLGDERRTAVVAAVRHEALPCPARKLELVVYTREQAGSPSAKTRFELNLNTGARVPELVETSPAPGTEHWYAIDRSVLGERGVALRGPRPEELFAAPTGSELAEVLADSVAWHREHIGDEATADDAVRNATRNLRRIETGEWVGKRELELPPGSPGSFLAETERRLRAAARDAA